MKTITVIFLALLSFELSAQSACKTTNNFFESAGGSSSDQTVKSSDGCKTLVMDTSFEKITLVLGNIPDEATDFTIVDHDATPGDGEIAITYYYYSGNEPETLELSTGNQKAHVCASEGKVVVTWSGVNFKGVVNGKITYKTKCEMACGG